MMADRLKAEIQSRPLANFADSTLVKVVNRGLLGRYDRRLAAHLHYELAIRKIADKRPN